MEIVIATLIATAVVIPIWASVSKIRDIMEDIKR